MGVGWGRGIDVRGGKGRDGGCGVEMASPVQGFFGFVYCEDSSQINISSGRWDWTGLEVSSAKEDSTSEAQKYDTTATGTLLDYAPSKDGYSFLGWYCYDNSAQTLYQPGETVSIPGNKYYNGEDGYLYIILVAKWEEASPYVPEGLIGRTNCNV